MKYFTLLVILFTSFNSDAQNLVAFREAPLTGASPYFLNGTAYIEEFDDGTFQFRLSDDYSTNSGPDVQIFMTNDSMFSSPINTVGALFIEDVGTQNGINHFSGAYTKATPTITSLADFDHVVFVCVIFGNLHWGDGSFSPIISACTSTTSSVIEERCDSYISPNGILYTTTGIYIDTISNALLCDSIITIDLTINTIDIATSSIDNVITSAEVGATYQWLDCNGNVEIAGATDQSYIVPATGDYAIVITKGSCTDTSACIKITIVGIDENIFGAAIRLHPNPSTKNTFIDLGSVTDVDITVMDITGKTIYFIENETSNQVNLNTAALNKGLYFISIQAKGQQRVLKLIKQ